MKVNESTLKSFRQARLNHLKLKDFQSFQLSPLEQEAINQNFEPFDFNLNGKPIIVDNVICGYILTSLESRLTWYNDQSGKTDFRHLILYRTLQEIQAQIDKLESLIKVKNSDLESETIGVKFNVSTLDKFYQDLLEKSGFERKYPDNQDSSYFFYSIKVKQYSGLKKVEIIIDEDYIDFWCKEGKRGLVPGQKILIESTQLTDLQLLYLLKNLLKIKVDFY